MSSAIHPLEALLRQCASAAPEPWYPRAFSARSGVPLEEVYQWLELLFLDGLVRKAPGSKETGPGVVLTPDGEKVLHDPEALRRLREGRSVRPGDPGGAAREMLLRPARPRVSRWLLYACLLWFGYSALLAQNAASLNLFLAGAQSEKVAEVISRSGALDLVQLVRGEWWRLLTAAFVHIGLLHLAMNMFWLFMAGGMAERMWGRLRFLVIYLLGAFGCSVAGASIDPHLAPSAGASGALCAMLGAELVWVLLNGRYLPRDLKRRWRLGLFFNVLIIGSLIFFFPAVGAWGHLGGGVTGVVVGLLLHYQRFGPRPVRWLALALLAALPVAGWFLIDHSRRTDPAWNQAEMAEFERYHGKQAEEALQEAEKAWAKLRPRVRKLLDRKEWDRHPDDVKGALKQLAEEQERLARADAEVLGAGPYLRDGALDKQKDAHRKIEREIEKLHEAQKPLEEGERKVNDDERMLEEKYLPALKRMAKDDNAFLVEQVKPLMDKPRGKRPAGDVERALERLGKLGAELDGLTGLCHKLDKLQYCRDDTVKEALLAARQYADALSDFGQLAQKGLAKPAEWTDKNGSDLDEATKKLEQAHKEFKDFMDRH
jgi:membrane associated rhomboid family serine protease